MGLGFIRVSNSARDGQKGGIDRKGDQPFQSITRDSDTVGPD